MKIKRPFTLANYFLLSGLDWETTNEELSVEFVVKAGKSWIDLVTDLKKKVKTSRSTLCRANILNGNDRYVQRFKVYDKYPVELYGDDEDLNLELLPEFCFADEPKAVVAGGKPNCDEKSHFFVLTNTKGIKTYGVCTQFYQKMGENQLSKLKSGSLFEVLRFDETENELRNRFQEFLIEKQEKDKYLLTFVFETCCALLEFGGVTEEELLSFIENQSLLARNDTRRAREIIGCSLDDVHELLQLFNSAWTILTYHLETFMNSLMSDESFYEVRAVCILSRLEHFSLFKLVLRKILSLVHENVELPIALERIIAHVITEVPEPPPGKLKVVFKLYDTHEDTFSCSRPPINKLPLFDMPLKPLFEALSCQNLLMVISALLVEKKVIVTSSSLYQLSMVMFGLAKVLFPLKLESPFLPVLPKSMLDIIDAPFPVFVGVHSSQVPDSHFLESKCVFVDIDKNSVEVSFGYEISQPPPSALAKLVRNLRKKVYGEQLKPLTSQDRGIRHFGPLYGLSDEQFNQGVREIFLLYLIDILRDYKKCLGGLQTDEVELFNRELFVKTHKETSIASEYLMELAGTQMIQMFCEERLFLPERNFEVMLFDAWVDKETKRGASTAKSHFLEDSSQEIVTEYFVTSPSSAEFSPRTYNSVFPSAFNWEMVPKQVPVDKLHKLRRGSHLLKNIKKVSLILEAVYLSFYTKRTVFGAKFKLFMNQVSTGCCELQDIASFLNQITSIFSTFLGRIKHTNPEVILSDDETELRDKDPYMSTQLWPSFLRSEKALVSLLEAYSFALQEKVLSPIEEMLRKLTNQRKLLKINGKRWFNKVETTKAEVEDLKKATSRTEDYVETCKRELRDFYKSINTKKANCCQSVNSVVVKRHLKYYQKRLVYAIVSAERTRLDFAEKVAFLNRELIKFSESLNELFKEMLKSEQKRLIKLRAILELVADLSSDFFQNLQNTMTDSLGRCTQTFLASQSLEKRNSHSTTDPVLKLDVQLSIGGEDSCNSILIPNKNEIGLGLKLTPERFELEKQEVFLPLLENKTYIIPNQVFDLKSHEFGKNNMLDTAEQKFEDWREYFRNVRKVYKFVFERAEIRAQAYSSLGSSLVQIVPVTDQETEGKSSSLWPSFIKRYGSSGPESTELNEIRTKESSFGVAIRKLKIGFGLFGKLLLEKGVSCLENDVVFFAKEASSVLKEIQRRELNIKNSVKRQHNFAIRVKEKSKLVYDKEQLNYDNYRRDYNEALQERMKNCRLITMVPSLPREQVIRSVLDGVISLIEGELSEKITLPTDIDVGNKIDRKVFKIYSKCQSANDDRNASRKVYEQSLVLENASRKDFKLKVAQSLHIFGIEDSLRIICTVRSFRKYLITFVSILSTLQTEFEQVKRDFSSIDMDVDYIVSKRLNSRLEKFSKTSMRALQRRSTNEEVDDLNAISDIEDKNVSFSENTFGSCDLSSCGDDASTISFAACMVNYFPTVLLYFHEFKIRLQNLEGYFASSIRIFENTLLSLSRLTLRKLDARSVDLQNIYSHLIQRLKQDQVLFKSFLSSYKELATKTWLLKKEMSKVVAVHAARKKYLDEMLAASEAIVEEKTATYLKFEADLEEAERKVTNNRYVKLKCCAPSWGKTHQQIIFSLRNRKEAEFREMCEAEKEMLLRKGTFDDCIAQILHRLQSNLESYLLEYQSIINSCCTTLDFTGSGFYKSLLSDYILEPQPKLDTQCNNYSGSVEAILKSFDLELEFLNEHVIACKRISTLATDALFIFATLCQHMHNIYEKYFALKIGSFSVMTLESSSTARSLQRIVDIQKQFLLRKKKYRKQLSIEVSKVMKTISNDALDLKEQIRSNSTRIMKDLKSAHRAYRGMNLGKNMNNKKQNKKEQMLHNAKIQARAELTVILKKKEEFVAKKNLELCRLSEICSILKAKLSTDIASLEMELADTLQESDPERDIQLFIEWHGKPLSSTTSSFSQRFSFQT